MWMLSVRSSECIDTLPGCDLYIYACTAIWELFVLVLYRILRKKILPLNCQWLLLQRKMDIFFREISFWAYSIMTESARKWRGEGAGGWEREREKIGRMRTCPYLSGTSDIYSILRQVLCLREAKWGEAKMRARKMYHRERKHGRPVRAYKRNVENVNNWQTKCEK